MKRYILLLVLVSMQANITLPNRDENNYLDRDEKKRIINQNFGKPFDDVFTKNDLDFENRKNAAPLKHLCNDYLLEHVNMFPYPNKEAIENAIKEEGAFCVADFVGAQKKAEYKKQTDRNPLIRFLSDYKSQFNGYFFEDAPKYDKATKEKIRQKASLQVVSDFKQGNRASFAYLVNDGPIEKDLLNKTEKLFKIRMLYHAVARVNKFTQALFEENSEDYDSRNWNDARRIVKACKF